MRSNEALDIRKRRAVLAKAIKSAIDGLTFQPYKPTVAISKDLGIGSITLEIGRVVKRVQIHPGASLEYGRKGLIGIEIDFEVLGFSPTDSVAQKRKIN